MHKVSKVVNQNISVMPVFDLENVTNYTVRCQTFDKVESRLHEGTAALVAVLFQEIIVEIYLESLSYLVPTVGVGHNFNYSTEKLVFASPVADTFVWSYEKLKVTLFEDLLEKFDELKGQDILTQVIIDLKNAGDNLDWLVGVLNRPLLLIKNHHLLL